MKIAITGKPGSGKTTLVKSLSIFLKSMGLPLWGFYTEEVREKAKRIGFDLVEVASGRRLPLARAGKGRFTVGKYRVEVQNINSFLEKKKGLLILDEVGRMELLSREFKDFVEEVLGEDGNVILTFGLNIPQELRSEIERKFEVCFLTPANRNQLEEKIKEKLRHEFGNKKD